jgi:hypothetical protein
MKNRHINKSEKNIKMSRIFWYFVSFAFLIGGACGYVTHYLVVNWHGFFVTCDDGNRPDKNGCCNGEVYTDAGDGWMVCCPNDADNCFPPLK